MDNSKAIVLIFKSNGMGTTSEQPFAQDTNKGCVSKKDKPLATPLPYRMMVPKPIRNLINPGRAVSVEGQVLGPVRVMAPCMAMGQAAGMAAALAVEKGTDTRGVAVADLQKSLVDMGAYLPNIDQ